MALVEAPRARKKEELLAVTRRAPRKMKLKTNPRKKITTTKVRNPARRKSHRYRSKE